MWEGVFAACSAADLGAGSMSPIYWKDQVKAFPHWKAACISNLVIYAGNRTIRVETVTTTLEEINADCNLANLMLIQIP